MKTNDNSSNQQNANKGTDGINKQYYQNQGNRGKQMNPNQGGKEWKEIVKFANQSTTAFV